MSEADTIAAIATPPGVSAVAIIRISGSRSFAIAQECFVALRPNAPGTSARLIRGWVTDPRSGEKIDDAMAARFRAPHSSTGEDVVELHVHGGAGVIAASLALVLRLGARLALPGEFTKRAFLNGRIDLAQAEAVADLIAAESDRASKAAVHRLSGDLGAQLRALRAELLERLVEIEAHVDYPDEVPEPDTSAIATTIAGQDARVEALLNGAGLSAVLRDGIACVIAGPPNAGKSSLLNALVQAERAIVSNIPGTTRDIIEDRVAVDGVVLRLSDTAGLRQTADPIEAEGVTRARAAISQAQLVIVVIDASKALGPDERIALAHTAQAQRIVLANKLDLGRLGLDQLRENPTSDAEPGAARSTLVAGSVSWSDTIAQVRRSIAELGWGGSLDGARALVANARQIQALTRARESLAHARQTLAEALPIDLVSADLRDASAAYGEVTGDTVTEEVLDGIFSRFCVGK